MTRFVIPAVAIVALALTASLAYADQLAIGSPAPTFNALEGTDGKNHSLADYKDKDVLVVCVTTNHCPVAVAYEDRIVNFAKKHAGPTSKVGFFAVNVNNAEDDRMPMMKQRAKEKGFVFTYAYDPSQKIARELKATRTPEFFVFDKDRKLVYTGALDDNQNMDKVTKHYLADAVEASLKGQKPATPTTTPVGCGIMYEQPR
jgi:thiol-disulfide isomerase/thioredoxin